MDEMTIILYVAILMLMCFFIGFGFAITVDPILNQVQAAIEACESSLPRDKSCEVVITAKVRDDGK